MVWFSTHMSGAIYKSLCTHPNYCAYGCAGILIHFPSQLFSWEVTLGLAWLGLWSPAQHITTALYFYTAYTWLLCDFCKTEIDDQCGLSWDFCMTFVWLKFLYRIYRSDHLYSSWLLLKYYLNFLVMQMCPEWTFSQAWSMSTFTSLLHNFCTTFALLYLLYLTFCFYRVWQPSSVDW
jgi:hypothetical protein